MNKITWKREAFTVAMQEPVASGSTATFTQEVSGFVAVGTGLGYWYNPDGIEGDMYFGQYTITHLASGLRVAADPRSDAEARRSIERMCQPFIWNSVNFQVNWNGTTEQLQALPYWGDIKAIRREHWSPLEVAA